MNQWCINNYDFTQAQSIQLEFKLTGCRDEENNSLALTAKAVAEAIKNTIKEDTMAKDKTKDVEQGQTINDTTDIVKVKQDITKPLTPDEEAKVEEAFNELKNIFHEGFCKTMLEAGQYLIKTFYNNDYIKAAEKKFSENHSLHALFKKISDGSSVKKTWLYDSINLALAENQFKGVSEFGKILNSHKLKIISSGLNEEIQIIVIRETYNNKYTVLQLKERIDALRTTTTTPIIEEKPKKVFLSLDEEMSEERLQKLNIERLERYIKEINEYEEDIAKKKVIYEANRKIIEDIISDKKKRQDKLSKRKQLKATTQTPTI